ncbi:MAG: phospho-N-acetylmuramoyl-pentapeptide-transferase [Planctomycetota bacterium]|nr:MAG: phospho-N-acetylmuramoyl-pentapeptide-transferase [Planctomycetota bacterium]
MLPFLANWLTAVWPDACDWQSAAALMPRAALAAATTLALSLASGPWIIAWLKERFREPIKCASAELAALQSAKHATPTMGGVFIVGGLVAALVLLGDWRNPYLPVVLFVAVGLGGLGVCDDLVKLNTDRRGLSACGKLAAQIAIALLAAVAVYRLHAPQDRGLELAMPLLGTYELGLAFVPLATLVIVASSNAVNLSDGLDGLAGGCLLSATAVIGIVAYLSGQAAWAAQLDIPHVAGASEMIVVAAALAGGLAAFLWFNCHPASVFMGDAGSLPLGGLLGLLAVVARQEILLLAVGGVFVVEAGSVILQVASFRLTGRRVFRCAPLHHHFQLGGWPEGQIVVRFWIAGALCGVVGLAGLTWHAGNGVPGASTHQPPAARAAQAPDQETPSLAELFR